MTRVRYRHAAGGKYVPGYPADPEHVLDLPDDDAAQLVATELYEVVGDEPPEDNAPASNGEQPAEEPADAPPATESADDGDTETEAED